VKKKGKDIGKAEFVNRFIVGMIAASDSEPHGISETDVVVRVVQLTINNMSNTVTVTKLMRYPTGSLWQITVRSHHNRGKKLRGLRQAQPSNSIIHWHPSLNEPLAMDKGK